MENLSTPVLQTRYDPETDRLPMQVPQAFLTKILTPYKPNVKYLKSASIVAVSWLGERDPSAKRTAGLVTAEGIFSIPSSCYIDDTGHFNSVEFNICYNQLAYVMLGKCLEKEIFPKVVPSWHENIKVNYEGFLKCQLSSMYIAKIEGKFMKPMDSLNFSARLTVNRIIWVGDINFIYTSISFSDEQGVKAMGDVLLAYNPGGNK